MKTFGKLMVLLVSLALVGSGAIAAGNAVKITGTVTAVDVAAKTLTVKADETKTDYPLKVEETTVIKKGDKVITLAEIKVGDMVEVELENNKVKTIIVKG